MNPMIKDAWLTEAQEATNSLQDLETKLNLNFNLSTTAESMLLDIGVKLDRLESLLLNPPTRPILTNEDLDFRWKMLSDIKLRTRTLARSVSASLPCPNRPSNVAAIGSNDNIGHYNQRFDENCKLQRSVRVDETSSVMRKPCSIFMFLGLAALLFLVVLLCTTI
ncbi:hypothetical protein PIB30_044946 [Stylosanthes scabra]|uniref:Syntaxin 6 N-terminal domain-containing protein n=1 Tax=Stylosanthes scabra TaxID=79078 RepID=A0ABU6QFF4_9FABA|nr:hypothetical protein [Stylosanthes scabra]